MSLSKWAGVLWLVASLLGVVLTVVFRNDQVQWVVTIIAGIAATVVGVLLIWRPTAGIRIGSTVVGAGWLVIYAGLTFQQRNDTVAWEADVFLGVLGVLAALGAFRQKASGRQSA